MAPLLLPFCRAKEGERSQGGMDVTGPFPPATQHCPSGFRYPQIPQRALPCRDTSSAPRTEHFQPAPSLSPHDMSPRCPITARGDPGWYQAAEDPHEMPQGHSRSPGAAAGLASGYFSRRLISSSCQLKQGWQPTGWRLQHGRARPSGDEKVNKHWCHPRAAAQAAAPGLCDSLRVPGEPRPRWPGQSKHKLRQGWPWGSFLLL